MEIKMLQTRRGSRDGSHVVRYYKDVVYYGVPELLAHEFIDKGWAIVATLQDMKDQIERSKAL